jgi:hypothetical protein
MVLLAVFTGATTSSGTGIGPGAGVGATSTGALVR